MPAAKTSPAPKAEPATTPVVVPTVPTVPSTWTPATIAAFAGGVAAFVLGILTMVGVMLPASVSVEVQTWAGILTSVVGAITPFFVMLSKHSVTKTALKQGVAPEVAYRL